jgi:trehalose 2-sulfotransferase
MSSPPRHAVRRAPWGAPPPVATVPWTLDTSHGVEAPEVTRVLIIASLPRSGSTLLSRALSATGELGVPEEYFNPHIIGNYRDTWGLPRLTMHGRAGILRRRVTGYTRPSLERYRDIIVNQTTSASGRFATKMHWHAYAVFADGPLDPLTWGLPVDWIHLRRTDVLRQAISFVRARQTQEWFTGDPATGVASYDAPEIARMLDRLREWGRGWPAFFATSGITPLEVSYEDLAADYTGQVRRALDHLGLPTTPVPPPPLARQADELNEEWAARFVAEHGPVHDGAT